MLTSDPARPGGPGALRGVGCRPTVDPASLPVPRLIRSSAGGSWRYRTEDGAITVYRHFERGQHGRLVTAGWEVAADAGHYAHAAGLPEARILAATIAAVRTGTRLYAAAVGDQVQVATLGHRNAGRTGVISALTVGDRHVYALVEIPGAAPVRLCLHHLATLDRGAKEQRTEPEEAEG